MEIKFSNIELLLQQIKNARHINIENLEWIDPVGIAILRQHKESNQDVKITTSGESYKYVEKILRSTRDNSKNHLPIEYFDQNTSNLDEIKSNITNKIISNAENLSDQDKEDLSRYLEYMISEMMGNVVSHSETCHGGFVTAQYYVNSKMVQVVIIDGGVGILRTLSDRHTLENEAEAIKKSMEKAVTGSNDFVPYRNVPRHAGLGLFFLSNIVKHTTGKLLIISNNTIYRYPEGTSKVLDTDFKGTIVSFEIYEEKLDYNFSQLFRIIGSEDEEDEEDVF